MFLPKMFVGCTQQQAINHPASCAGPTVALPGLWRQPLPLPVHGACLRMGRPCGCGMPEARRRQASPSPLPFWALCVRLWGVCLTAPVPLRFLSVVDAGGLPRRRTLRNRMASRGLSSLKCPVGVPALLGSALALPVPLLASSILFPCVAWPCAGWPRHLATKPYFFPNLLQILIPEKQYDVTLATLDASGGSSDPITYTMLVNPSNLVRGAGRRPP